MPDSNLVEKRRGRFVRYVPLVLWIGVILVLSTGQGAMPQTSRFIRPLLEFLFPDASEATLLLYHGVIRKSAHFIEYGVLALLAARAFFASSKPVLSRYWFLAAFVTVLAVAAIDETGQSFNESRTGSVWDVLLDLAGCTAAVTAYYVAMRRRVL